MMIQRTARTTVLVAAALGAGLLFGGCGAASGPAPGSTLAGGEGVDQMMSLVDDSGSTTGVGGSTGSDTTSSSAVPGCTAQQRWGALATVAPQVRDYLNAHPEVAAELDHLRGLPVEQRRSEARSYLQAHPELRGTGRQLRDEVVHFRQTCSAS